VLLQTTRPPHHVGHGLKRLGMRCHSGPAPGRRARAVPPACRSRVIDLSRGHI
jgi:hypothetical protein